MLCTMCTLLVECSEGWVRGFFWSSVGRGETGTRVSLTMVLGMLALIVMMMMLVVVVVVVVMMVVMVVINSW